MVENFRMEKLTLAHLEQMMQLQQIVHQSIADPSLCVQLTVEEMKELLVDDTGLTVGIFHNDQLIGFHSALIPSKREDNLGYELNLQEDVLDDIFHLEICLVHPHFRGKALQAKMSSWLIRQFQLSDRFRYLCETAAPHNFGSVKNTLAIGAYIVQLKRMYGNYERYIFFQDIKQPLAIDETTKVEVQMNDKNNQQQLFAKGYVGYQMVNKDGEHKLLFAKLQHGNIPYK